MYVNNLSKGLEEGLILALLEKPEEILLVEGVLKAEYFAIPHLGVCYGKILANKNKITKNGDTTFLLEIAGLDVNQVQDWSSITFGEKVNSVSVANRIMDIFRAKMMATATANIPTDLDELTKWNNSLKDMVARLSILKIVPQADDTFLNYFEKLSERMDSTVVTKSYATGWKEVDDMLYGGINKGVYVVVAAESGHGKTSTSINLIYNMLKNEETEKKIDSLMFFSMEMGVKMAGDKLYSLFTDVDTYKIGRALKLNDIDSQRVQDACSNERLANSIMSKIILCDKENLGGATMELIEARIKLEIANRGVDIVVLDQADYIDKPNFKDEHLGYVALSGWVKKMKDELGVTIILISQLNKVDGALQMAKSKQLVKDADTVIHVNRPGLTALDNELGDNYIRMQLVKNRQGKTGTCDLSWIGVTGTVGNLSAFQRQNLLDYTEQQEEKKNVRRKKKE
jgi:replicative DNA helicase